MKGAAMSVLMLAEWEDASTDQYDRVNEVMGISGDANAPDGLISHVAAVSDDGKLLIADVWESPEALNAFFTERLSGAMREVGIPERPPRVLPLHNHSRGRGEPNVVMLIELEGTTDTYDKMRAEMPAHEGDGRNHPAYSHTVAIDGDKLVVVDLWASPEAFQQFAEEQIGPAAAKHGVAGFHAKSYRVHNKTVGKATANI
jgi:heme-degrading monooxygenase HmoA